MMKTKPTKLEKQQAIPGAGVLLGYRNAIWRVHEALAELVDNSRGLGRGNARNIWIDWRVRTRILSVLDDGVGMTPSVFNLFTLGSESNRVKGDIGRYGLGGTRAILWLYDACNVYTFRDRKANWDSVDWEQVIASDTFPWIDPNWNKPMSRNCPPMLRDLGHGTLVIGRLRHGKHLHEEVVKRELQRMFAPALNAGRSIFFNDVPLEPYKPEFVESVQVSVRFKSNENGKTVTAEGKVGIVEDLRPDWSNISLACAERIVDSTRDYFVNEKGETVSTRRITGLIDLNDDWELSDDKTKIINDEDRDHLRREIIAQIQPLLKIEEKHKLNIEFTDLKIQLQGIKAEGLKVPRKSIKPPKIEGKDGEGKKRKRHKHDDQPDDPEGTKTKTKEKPAAGGTVGFDFVPGDSIDGALCTFNGQDNAFIGLVNEDVAYIQTVRKFMPRVREIVIGELAHHINETEERIAQWFSPTEARELIQQAGDDITLRRQLIHRALVERISNPLAE
jgi:hypothetical protein